MGLKLYIGTYKPPVILEGESQYDFLNRTTDYNKHPFALFYAKNNANAIRIAKDMNLKDLCLTTNIWNEY